MSVQAAYIGAAIVASITMIGILWVTVAEEFRHRRNERDVSIDALVTAFRIHEVAASARSAMSDEIARLSEPGE